MSAPTIVEVEGRHVLVPLRHEWCTSEEFGGHHDGPVRILVRLTDSDGACGWGEGMAGPIPQRDGAVLRQLRGLRLDHVRLAELPLAVSPNYFQVPPFPSPFSQDDARQRHRVLHPLQTPVEMALLDLLARRAGVPLSQLFGGRWRDRVAVDYWMGRVSSVDAARIVRHARGLGFSGVKLKTTLHDPNVERLEAIRDAAGEDFHVTVDANGRFYRLDDALPTLRAMDAVGNMQVLEDPFHRFNLQEFTAVRPRLSARLAVHVDPPESLSQVIGSGAAGCLNLSSHTHGLHAWRCQAAVAEAANLAIWHGGALDYGIATAAQLQLAAATPNCQLPGDQAGPWVRVSSLISTRFIVEQGQVLLPPGHGLGVTVDEDALDRYTIQRLET